MKKAELEKEIERLKSENKRLRILVEVGQRFSNIAYNYTQHIEPHTYPDLVRILKGLLAEWDKVKGV